MISCRYCTPHACVDPALCAVCLILALPLVSLGSCKWCTEETLLYYALLIFNMDWRTTLRSHSHHVGPALYTVWSFLRSSLHIKWSISLYTCKRYYIQGYHVLLFNMESNCWRTIYCLPMHTASLVANKFFVNSYQMNYHEKIVRNSVLSVKYL